MGLEGLLDKVSGGSWQDLGVEVSQGRLNEERNVIFTSEGLRLIVVKVFLGRRPHYLPWVEVSVEGNLKPHEIVALFSDALGPGGRMFVEYSWDEETREGLIRGFPPTTTPLGFFLLRQGFTWFKDWYFPEGFKEGDLKLQAEKPLNDSYREKHVDDLVSDVTSFLSSPKDGELYRRASERGRKVIEIVG